LLPPATETAGTLSRVGPLSFSFSRPLVVPFLLLLLLLLLLFFAFVLVLFLLCVVGRTLLPDCVGRAQTPLIIIRLSTPLRH